MDWVDRADPLNGSSRLNGFNGLRDLSGLSGRSESSGFNGLRRWDVRRAEKKATWGSSKTPNE